MDQGAGTPARAYRREADGRRARARADPGAVLFRRESEADGSGLARARRAEVRDGRRDPRATVRAAPRARDAPPRGRAMVLPEWRRTRLLPFSLRLRLRRRPARPWDRAPLGRGTTRAARRSLVARPSRQGDARHVPPPRRKAPR